MPDSVEVGQGEHGLRPRQVLGQAAVAHLGETPQLLDHAEGVFAAGARARTRPIDHPPALAQWVPGGGPPIYSVAYAPALKELTVVFFPVRLIAEHLALSSVQKLQHLGDIGDRGISRSYAVDDPALIGRPENPPAFPVEEENSMRFVLPDGRLPELHEQNQLVWP